MKAFVMSAGILDREQIEWHRQPRDIVDVKLHANWTGKGYPRYDVSLILVRPTQTIMLSHRFQDLSGIALVLRGSQSRQFLGIAWESLKSEKGNIPPRIAGEGSLQLRRVTRLRSGTGSPRTITGKLTISGYGQ